MEQLPLSRRGLPTYEKNPSIKTAMQEQRTGIKRISSNKSSNKEMILSDKATGEIITGVDVGFHERIKVDKTQFVKLYIAGVSAFIGLSKAGGRVLEAVLNEVNKNVGKDMLFISPRVADNLYGIKKSTFMSGLRNLLSREVLYEHIEENWYFINVNYIFNGDRLAFLQTYELDTGEVVDVEAMENPNQGLLPFEGEISTEYFEEDTGLIVPFNEAEEFKALASDFCPKRKWDNERKLWIVQAGTPKEPFVKWL
jgi:hypothetical protein